jgi:hypothetical protein
LDFFVLDDNSIEMELWEHADDDFATIDIPTAIRVVEIAMTDIRDMTLRQKLEDLAIHWLA